MVNGSLHGREQKENTKNVPCQNFEEWPDSILWVAYFGQYPPLERQYIEFIEREQDHGEARQNQQCVRDHSHASITARHKAGFKARALSPDFGQPSLRQNRQGTKWRVARSYFNQIWNPPGAAP